MVTSYQWLSIHKNIFPLAPTCLIFTEWNSWFERICRRPKQFFCFGFTTKISYEMPLQATLKRRSTRMRIASYKLIISLTCRYYSGIFLFILKGNTALGRWEIDKISDHFNFFRDWVISLRFEICAKL